MPTGSGKTWVYSIIAKHYSLQGKATTIIVPTDALRQQTIDEIGLSDEKLQVLTIVQFYENPTKDEVLVVDEYDEFYEKSPLYSLGTSVTSLWALANRELIFFTATSSRMLERIVGKIFGDYQHLQLQSEYKVTEGCSSVEQGIIKP